MERLEWLKKVRAQAERLYDHGAPAYWVIWGMDIEETHRQFIEKLLGQMPTNSYILDAACGAGIYDGLLLDAGHRVLGIDQSGGVLARAREHFPQESFPKLKYAKLGLQEMDFEEAFEGLICMDAMEHICPEDWPVILDCFQKALKPGGMLYITVDTEKEEEDRKAFERAKAMGLPVVYGEIVDELDEAYDQAMTLDALELNSMPFEKLDHTVYHYHPSVGQVRRWLDQTGLVVVEQGTGEWYEHFLARKKEQ